MLNTVIVDMDGLLIDSEPFWEEAGRETLNDYGVQLTNEQYHISTGLRTKEWIAYWFTYFNISLTHAEEAEANILQKAIKKISENALPMPGVEQLFNFFTSQHFKIGLASSSPMALIDIVIDKLHIQHFIQVKSSAEFLPYGKPHPQVFLDCAALLNADPLECICFEDSFNGMIAAKAARMKCVVVPAQQQQQQKKWAAADIQLSSLMGFNESTLALLLK